MTESIKLPPLPSPFGIVDPIDANECGIYDLKDLHDYAEAYATAAIKADRQVRQCECQRKTNAVIHSEREL